MAASRPSAAAPSGTMEEVIHSAGNVLERAVSRSNISRGLIPGVIRGATGTYRITFHVSALSPWEQAFKPEYLSELDGNFEEIDPRHGYIQSAFSSHIMTGSVYNAATQRVSHDTETTKDFRCVIEGRNTLADHLTAIIAVLAKLHYPVTMIFIQEGAVSVAYEGRIEKVPKLSQEVFLLRYDDLHILTPWGGYPLFHAGNNGQNSLYHGRPDRLSRAISRSVCYHQGVVDQLENLRLDIRICRAAVDTQLSLSCFCEICVQEKVIDEARGDITYVERSMTAAKGIRDRIELELSAPVMAAIRAIPDLLLKKPFWYPALAKIIAVIQPITRSEQFRSSIVQELFERDNLISLPTFLHGGRTKYHSKEATIAGFIREISHQTLIAVQTEVSKLSRDNLSIRDVEAVDNIGDGVSALMAFFTPTMPSVMQTMVSLSWDFRMTDEEGVTIGDGGGYNPGYLLNISTPYSRTKVEDVSGWAPADIRRAQLPSYLVPKPTTIIADEEVSAIFGIMADNYPSETIAATWDSYRSRAKEVDIIRSKFNFEYAKNIIYEELNSQPDQTARDRRWIIRTSRIWATLVTHLTHREETIDDNDTLSDIEDEAAYFAREQTLGSSKLRWYPTAAALSSFISETWADRPGSQTSIVEDEPLHFA